MRASRFGEADAAADLPRAGAVVEIGGEEQALHAHFLIIMRGLQQQGRFASVHGGVVEMQLGHMRRLDRFV